MPLEYGIRTLFIAEATITTLVSTTGVYVSFNQFTEDDYIIIDTVSTDFNPTLQNDLSGSASTGKEKSINFDCFSATAEGARAIADAVLTYFDDFSGVAGTDTIMQVTFIDDFDSTLPPADGEGLPEFSITLSTDILYRET